jgi:colanic acid biosynthesis glycosyl transferase WcaI
MKFFFAIGKNGSFHGIAPNRANLLSKVPMKILVVTQYFWPEEFLINDVVLALRARNHEIEVLTGLPNYPSGRFFSGYGYGGPYRDDYQGIPVWRSPLIPRGNASGWRLVLNYFSFALLATLRGLFACHRPFDVILFFQLSPMTAGIPARVMKALSGAKMFFWVQDLWPDSLSATGAIRSERMLKWVGALTRWLYQGGDCILLKSEAYRESVLQCGASDGQIRYLPDWADDLFQPLTLPAKAPERNLMPAGFRVMFAGNIGVAQDFETILTAAELTRPQSEIQWVILGDGRQRPWVEEQIRVRMLTNVHLLGRHAKEKMPAFFSLADVMLVSLKRELIFSMTIPAKIQAYLACGKPILASLDGEGARIIREAKAGIAVAAEDPHELAKTVLEIFALGPEAFESMGRNASMYYETHFSRAFLLDKLEGWLHEYIADSNNAPR